MTGKTRNLTIAGILAAVLVIGTAIAVYCYQESRKSGLEKGAEKTVNWTDSAVDKTARATKDAAKWTDKKVNQAADKTQKLFK